jgi:hypothetical protein
MAPTDDLRGPDIASLHPDPDVARRPGPELRDSAGIMDADRTARALGLRREHVQAAVREQATREAQLGDWARQEAAGQAAAGGPERAGAELDAETGRLAEACPEPAGRTGNGWYSAPPGEVVAPGDEPGIDAARWVPGQERDEREVAEDLLRRHAAEAEDALRRERRATAYERFAQRVHDPELLGLARDVARNARADRQTATKNAHIAAARLQQSALGPELEDSEGLYRHGGYLSWSPDVTPPPIAERQMEAG